VYIQIIHDTMEATVTVKKIATLKQPFTWLVVHDTLVL